MCVYICMHTLIYESGQMHHRARLELEDTLECQCSCPTLFQTGSPVVFLSSCQASWPASFCLCFSSCLSIGVRRVPPYLCYVSSEDLNQVFTACGKHWIHWALSLKTPLFFNCPHFYFYTIRNNFHLTRPIALPGHREMSVLKMKGSCLLG